MRIVLIFTITTLTSMSVLLFAQGVNITGRIVDSETLEPLPYAHVFIDQTTIGAVSNENGEYLIEHVPNGDYKLVFSFVGYELYYKVVAVTGQDLRISARLIPIKEMLESIEIKGSKDKEWESQLKQFTKVFFGDRDLAKDCSLLNPWVLDFTYDKSDKVFKATASEPVQIENKALGYHIECTLQNFIFDKKGYKIKGLYKFEEINTLDTREAAKWTRNRRQAYQSSLRFLFKSIMDRHVKENGFELYLDKRPQVAVANTYFANELDKRVFEFNINDQIIPSGRPGYYRITIPNRLEIHHTTQFARSKTYRDVINPVSWIELEKGYVEVSQDGYIVNSHHLVTSGELNGNRIAAMLPTNYSPGNVVVVNYLTKRAKAKRLQERAYLHTDKAFYYPGETIWLRAHMNYSNQSLRDSLSQVLYLELINQKKEIKTSKILKIDSLGAYGEINLPETLDPGTYYVRSYTSWMRNYGNDVIFLQPIIVMAGTQKIMNTKVQEKNTDFIVDLIQKNIHTSEIIQLNLSLDSTRITGPASCSISFTPVEWSSYPGAQDIKESLFFPDEMPSGTLADLTYPLEYGFSIQGVLTQPKKKYASGNMSVIRGRLDSLYRFRTDSKGYFKIEDLVFFDTVTFSFQAKNRKGKIFGTTKLLARDFPSIQLPKTEPKPGDLDTIELDTPVKITSIAPKDTVPIQQKTQDASLSTTNLNADYIITEADLDKMSGGQNIMDAIVGRVSGLQFDALTGKLAFRNRPGLNGNSEPLIVVDGIPINNPTELNTVMNQRQQQKLEQAPVVNNTSTSMIETTSSSSEASANRSLQLTANNASVPTITQNSVSTRELLGHILVSNVSRVEVMSRPDPRYGLGSTNGVIVIYTKKAQGKNKDIKNFDFIVVDGFAKPSPFKTLDHNMLITPDFNSTVYWNPSITISSKGKVMVSFPAPGKPGEYLMKIEGVTTTGVPLSGSILIRVTDELKTKLGQHQK